MDRNDFDAVTTGGRPARTLLVFGLAFSLGLLAALLALMVAVRGSRNWPEGVLSTWLRRTTHTDLSQPTVVDHIRRLQRLETVVYAMDKIVTGEKQSAILPDFLAGDRLLLLVHGEVIAGIDFHALESGDIHVSGRTAVIRLPQAQILVTRLDSSKTRVYSRQTGVLVPTDPNLETEVRQQAEEELRRSAIADGILQKAQENARVTLLTLLQGMGFVDVKFE
jgi:Protein of unknown function (DUF4230)